MAEQAVFHINTLGGFAIEPKAIATPSKRSAALLAYLAETGGRRTTRRELAELLWDCTAKRPLHSLSQLLYEMRSWLPTDWLYISPMELGIHTDAIQTDLFEFRRAIRTGDLVLATELYKGEFLDGFPYITDQFDDWRIETAARLRADAVGMFNVRLTEALDQEDYSTAADIAQTALIVSPTEPRLIRLRVEALAASGEVRRALRELEIGRQRVRLELGNLPAELGANLDVTLTRVAAESPQPLTPRPQLRLVGRELELQRLRNHWRSKNSAIRIALVHGEPGIGKTRLFEHAIRRAALDGARVFHVRCSQAEACLPYGTVAALLRSGFRPPDSQALPTLWQEILATIAPELFPSSAPAHGCAQRALWEATASFFAQAARRQQIIICVDNYSWADETSKDLLKYLMQRLAAANVWIIIASREATGILPQDLDNAALIEIVLERLDATSTAELISLAEAEYGLALTADVRAKVTAEVGGHPLFLLEVLQQLRNAGGDQWKGLRSILLSPTLEGHLAERLRGASDESKKLMDVMAVLGRPASLHLLARITGLSPASTAGAMDLLVKQAIFSDSASVWFSHDLLFEVHIKTLRAADRRLWHGRTADVLLQGVEYNAAEVAYHYEQAEEYSAAYALADVAKNEALALHAHAEVEEQFRRMIRCAPRERALHSQGEYVKWLSQCARIREVAKYKKQLRPYFETAGDTDGVLALKLSDFEEAEHQCSSSASDMLQNALALIEWVEEECPAQSPIVLWQVADALRRNEAYGVIARVADRVIERLRAAPAQQAAEGLSIAALLRALSAGYRAAMPVAEDAVNCAQSTGDTILLAKALYARGTICLWAGRVAQADGDYADVVTHANPIGPDNLIERMNTNCAVLLLEQGRLEEARNRAIYALQGSPEARRGYIYGNLAKISLRMGDSAEAKRWAEQMLSWNEAVQHVWIPAHAHALAGLAELAQDRVEEAVRRAELVKCTIRTGSGMMDLSHAFLLLSRVTELTEGPAAALMVANQGRSEVLRRDRLAGARLCLEMGRLLWSLDERAARRLIQGVIAFAEAHGAVSVALEAKALKSVMVSESTSGD